MKQCDVCNNLNPIQYRVKSINYPKWIFVVKNVVIASQRKRTIIMAVRENQPKIAFFKPKEND